MESKGVVKRGGKESERKKQQRERMSERGDNNMLLKRGKMIVDEGMK